MRAFVPIVLKQMHMELLVQGNFYKEDALRIADLVEQSVRPCCLPAS